jgi:hypothetical protein
LGGLRGAAVGAAFGALSSGALHLLQTHSFNGLGDAILSGAEMGALYGSIIGAASQNPVLFAIALDAIYGISLYNTIPLLTNSNIRLETKAALVMLLIVGGRSAAKANISAFNAASFVSDAAAFSGQSVGELTSKTTPEQPGLNKIFGKGIDGGKANLEAAQNGTLKVPNGLSRDAMLAYREIAIQNIADSTSSPALVQVQTIRASIINALLYPADPSIFSGAPTMPPQVK